MMGIRKAAGIVPLLSIILLVQQGCVKPIIQTAPLHVSSGCIILEWDAPPEAKLLPPGTQLHYLVYYRKQSEDWWRLIRETVGETNASIAQSDVGGDGVYVFGVKAVSSSGVATGIATSLDFNAEPIGGWYIFWTK
jgi:hypothetical protein